MFTPFPRLPLETRLTIWRTAVPLFPRVFTVGRPNVKNTTFTVRASSHPTLLGVNKESRNEILPYYQAKFNEHGIDPAKKSNDIPKSISDLRMNFEIDTLFFDCLGIPVYSFTTSGPPPPLCWLFEKLFGEQQVVSRELVHLAATDMFWTGLFYTAPLRQGVDIWKGCESLRNVLWVTLYSPGEFAVVGFEETDRFLEIWRTRSGATMVDRVNWLRESMGQSSVKWKEERVVKVFRAVVKEETE